MVVRGRGLALTTTLHLLHYPVEAETQNYNSPGNKPWAVAEKDYPQALVLV